VQLEYSQNWPPIVKRLAAMKSRRAVAYFFRRLGDMSGKTELSRQEDDVSEGCYFALITMKDALGEEGFAAICSSLLADPSTGEAARAVIRKELQEREESRLRRGDPVPPPLPPPAPAPRGS
jgi:hypothetical protein